MHLSFTIGCLAAFVACTSVTPASAIDNIDCSRDHSAAERTICGSQTLQILDAQVTQAYASIMQNNRTNADVKARLRDSQYSFLERRENCGRNVECLTEVMAVRASRINFYR